MHGHELRRTAWSWPSIRRACVPGRAGRLRHRIGAAGRRFRRGGDPLFRVFQGGDAAGGPCANRSPSARNAPWSRTRPSRSASSWILPPRGFRRRSTTRPPRSWPSTRSITSFATSAAAVWMTGKSAMRRAGLRLVYRTPDWDDFVHLAVTEIRHFGGASIQVARRLRAMLENLIQTLARRARPAASSGVDACCIAPPNASFRTRKIGPWPRSAISRAWAASRAEPDGPPGQPRRHRHDHRPADQLLVTITLIEMMVAIGLGVTVRRVDRRRPGLAPGGAGRPGELRLRPRGHGRPVAPVPCPPHGRGRVPHPRGLPRGPVRPAVHRDRQGKPRRLGGVDGDPGGVVRDRSHRSSCIPCCPWCRGANRSGSMRPGSSAPCSLTQFVPLCVGLAVRQWCPILADRLQHPANLVCKVLNLVTVGLILVAQFRMLTAIRPIGFRGDAGPVDRQPRVRLAGRRAGPWRPQGRGVATVPPQRGRRPGHRDGQLRRHARRIRRARLRNRRDFRVPVARPVVGPTCGGEFSAASGGEEVRQG